MLAHIVQKSLAVSRESPRGLAFALFGLFYPPCCAHCHARIDRHGALCSRCWSRVQFIERPFCEVLGTPFAHDPGDGMVSAAAIAKPPAFDRLRSVALHQDIARDLVHDLKYRDRGDLAPMMAAWMVRAGGVELAVADAVLPVPLHRTRLLRRMFNQSAELGRYVARLADKDFLPEALVRRKRTEQQVGLTANARALNVRSAFSVPEERRHLVFGRRLVLIDDVYTTGATVGAATAALKKAGAADVTVLTFARAVSGPI